ncbi:MAG: HemK2/MTQ2 family protein methyltransferase [Thermoplasmata archaeon]
MKIERCQGVYEPDDDSYLLIGIEEIKGNLIEIGCGTGIVGLHYAAKGVSTILVDISREAVNCARKNALLNRIYVGIIRADMFEGIKGKFDYCIFNPPYLPEDSPNHASWTGGKKGNEITIRFLGGIRNFSKHAFYIESSLSPIPKDVFEGLSFETLKKIDYEFEELSLVKVTVNAIDR